jgi:hypothetical protein
MSRSSLAAIGLCTGLICVFALDVTADAQWWQIGSGPRGGMRYRGPLLSIDIGGATPPAAVHQPPAHHSYGLVPAPVPPWHYRHDSPHAGQSVAEQERFYHQLDRTHRYRTREERYADDFRDRYASGDPFYHNPYTAYSSTLGRAGFDQTAPVPGLSYGAAGGQGRSFVADAEVGDLLRPAAMRLINSLSRKRDGALWMKHLQPDRIVSAIDRAEFPGTLADLVEQYDGVTQNPRLVLIAEAEGFRDTHRLLSQYVLLQSRFATSDHPEQEYEIFMGTGQSDPHVGEVMINPYPSPGPQPSELNPAAQVPTTTQESASEEVIQYLPAPVGEPDPQP